MLLALQMWSMPSCSTQWGQKKSEVGFDFFKDKLMQEGTFVCVSATEQFDNANKGSEKNTFSHKFSFKSTFLEKKVILVSKKILFLEIEVLEFDCDFKTVLVLF